MSGKLFILRTNRSSPSHVWLRSRVRSLVIYQTISLRARLLTQGYQMEHKYNGMKPIISLSSWVLYSLYETILYIFKFTELFHKKNGIT